VAGEEPDLPFPQIEHHSRSAIMSEPSEKSAGTSAIPADDLQRTLVVARPDESLEHLALV
jgi:hypothetical protein